MVRGPRPRGRGLCCLEPQICSLGLMFSFSCLMTRGIGARPIGPQLLEVPVDMACFFLALHYASKTCLGAKQLTFLGTKMMKARASRERAKEGCAAALATQKALRRVCPQHYEPPAPASSDGLPRGAPFLLLDPCRVLSPFLDGIEQSLSLPSTPPPPH